MKGSDTCQHKTKFVLTFTKNDLTLVEIYAITLNFGSDNCQIKVAIVQVNSKVVGKCVRCPTVISYSGYISSEHINTNSLILDDPVRRKTF